MHTAVQTVQIPRLTVSDVRIEFQRSVLGQDSHCVDTGIDAVRQGKIDNAVFSSEGDSGFGHFFCQDIEPGALSACQ